MKLSCAHSLGLSLLLTLAFCKAENATQVACSAEQKVFVAQTEFLLEGSNEFFDSVERNALQTAFVDIYNMITRESCDSQFRRLNALAFVSMSNQLNETITSEDSDLLSKLEQMGGPPNQDGPPSEEGINNMTGGSFPLLPDGELPPLPGDGPPDGMPLGGPPPGGPPPGGPPPGGPGGGGPPPGGPPPFGRVRRRLQSEGYDASTTNTTSDASISTVYNVTGTCRECQLSRAGSFQLFDDSFRLRIRVRVLSITEDTRALQGRPLGGGGPPGGFPPANSNNGSPPADAPLPVEETPPMVSNTENSEDDCTCAAGMEPLQPQAPSVSKLIEFLNARLQQAQEENGVFKNIRFENLLQLDNLEEDIAVDEMDEETNTAIEAQEAVVSSVAKKSSKSATASESPNKMESTASSATSSGVTRLLQIPVLVLGSAAALVL